MLSRSLGNRGWEKNCGAKYSCKESLEDKARAAVKAITYILLPDLLPSANLSPFPNAAKDRVKLYRIIASLSMLSIVFLILLVCEYSLNYGKSMKKSDFVPLDWDFVKSVCQPHYPECFCPHIKLCHDDRRQRSRIISYLDIKNHSWNCSKNTLTPC